MAKRTGPLNKREMAFIQANKHQMSPEEMAKTLQRTNKLVVSYLHTLEREADLATDEDQQALLDLSCRPYWVDLRNQYNRHELELYQYFWAKFIQQFGFDITTAEEIQVLKLIDVELMIQRNKLERSVSDREIEGVKAALKEEESRGPAKDISVIQNCYQMIAGMRSAQLNRSKEYNDLLDKHQKLVRELKATRDQRLKDVQEKKVSLFSWLKQFDDYTTRSRLSRDAEVMAVAVDKEYQRLAQPHTYMDGTVDLPILNHETIGMVEDAAELSEEQGDEG